MAQIYFYVAGNFFVFHANSDTIYSHFQLTAIPVESRLDIANCIDNLSDSIKFSFDCNSNVNDIQIGKDASHHDARVLELTSCHNVSLGNFVSNSPWIFIVSVEGNLTEKEVENLLEDLKEVERPFLVNIYDKNVGEEKNYRTTDELMEFVPIEFDPKIKIKPTQLLSNFSSDDFLMTLVRGKIYDEDFKDGKLILEAIRSQCTLCVRFAQLVHPKVLNHLKILDKDSEGLKCDQQCFKSILDVPFTFDFNAIPSKVSNLLHEKFINDIKSIKTQGMRIGHNSFTLEKFLNKTSLRMHLEGLSALAWSQREFQVFEFLIRADCPFPQNYSDADKKNDKYVQKVNNHVKEVKKFHEYIKIGNYEQVKKFLKQHPKLTFARNAKNKSALQVAFESRQFKIFALLRYQGLRLSNLEEISEHYYQTSKLDEKVKKKMREINRKFVTPAVGVDVIDQLMMQSFIAQNSKNLDYEKIKIELRKAFVALNENAPEILKIIAAAKNFEIVFDFENEVVDEFDPTQTFNSGTAFYFRNYAIVAAKFLLSNDKYDRNHVLGTLAHELAHVAMNILYDNGVNPYVLDDEANIRKFNEIAKECRRNMNETSSMRILFEEKRDEDTHGELIARVPDMLLTYANRSKLKHVQNVYKSLFEFYDKNILRDVQAMASSMEARIKIQDLNKWLEVVQEIKSLDEESIFKFSDGELTLESDAKVQIFITNHTKSLLRKIYVKAMNSKALAVFLKSSFATHKHFKEAFHEIDKIRADVLLVIYCDDNLELLKRFKEMFEVLAIERVIFVVKEVNKKEVLRVNFGDKIVKVWK